MFGIGFNENGAELVSSIPIPRTPRVNSQDLYSTITRVLELQRRMNLEEEFDSPEEFMDFDDDDENEPYTEAEIACLKMFQAMDERSQNRVFSRVTKPQAEVAPEAKPNTSEAKPNTSSGGATATSS